MDFICPSCTAYSSAYAKNVYRHLRDDHGAPEEDVEEYIREMEERREMDKLEKRRQSQAGLPIECPHCPERFTERKRLTQHIKRKHPAQQDLQVNS